jgi:hypothetical protein
MDGQLVLDVRSRPLWAHISSTDAAAGEDSREVVPNTTGTWMDDASTPMLLPLPDGRSAADGEPDAAFGSGVSGLAAAWPACAVLASKSFGGEVKRAPPLSRSLEELDTLRRIVWRSRGAEKGARGAGGEGSFEYDGMTSAGLFCVDSALPVARGIVAGAVRLVAATVATAATAAAASAASAALPRSASESSLPVGENSGGEEAERISIGASCNNRSHGGSSSSRGVMGRLAGAL